MKTIGLYIHIPFCRSKCPYCDFYSLTRREDLFPSYARAVTGRLRALAARYRVQADTLYLGGGTPSLIGGELLAEIITPAAYSCSNSSRSQEEGLHSTVISAFDEI